MLLGTLYPTPPYRFDYLLAIARLHTSVDVIEAGIYRRALAIGAGRALVRVAAHGPVDAPTLDVHLEASVGPVEPAEALARVGVLLAVADDRLTPFCAMARADPDLWRVVEPLAGLRHIRSPDLFEALMVTIIEQQIALALAQRAERWLIASYGEAMRHAGRAYHLFPTAARLAALSPDDLRPMKITMRRAGVLLDIARAVDSGTLDLAAVAALPAPEAHRALVKLRGVGPWTAAWALIRATGYYHYMGTGDVALRSAVNHFFYGETGRATPARTDAALLRYGEYAGAAAFFTLMRWGLLRY